MYVLSHMFLTTGNGLKFAHTKNPEKGGYIVYPRYRNLHGEEIRIYDKPYGKEKYIGPDLDKVWNSDATLIEIQKGFGLGSEVVWVGLDEDFDQIKDNFPIAELKSEYDLPKKDQYFIKKYTKNSKDEYIAMRKERGVDEKELTWNPYPFSKNYSILSNIENQFIQPDYRDAAIYILNHTLNYLKDKDGYNEYYREMNQDHISSIINDINCCIDVLARK